MKQLAIILSLLVAAPCFGQSVAQPIGLKASAIGVTIQAYDSDLTTWAGVASSANGRSLVSAADYAGMRTLLSLVPGTNVQVYDLDLDDLADGTLTGSKVSGAVTVSGGTVNSSVIGGVTPAAITGTTITATTSVTTVDAAYNSGTWDGDNTVPTKNAVRDQIQLMLAGGGLGTGDIDTSAELRSIVTDETGTGSLVFATSPTLTTPNLGTPSAITLTSGTGLPISTGVSGLGTGVSTMLATPNSANTATAITDETGSGSLVFATSPTLTTPNLGTPSAATLTNATGLPIASGVSGLGTGVATMLGTPSTANLATAITGETGSGAVVFGTSPTISGATITGGSFTGGTDIAIADGGTGVSTLPSGLLKGAGTSAITAAVNGTDFVAPDAELTPILGVTSAADRLFYYTGSGTGSLATFTSFARSIVDDSDAATVRGTIGVDQGNAPIVLVTSLGVRTAYGVGSANSTALGTALATAVAAMNASGGDQLIINGPANYSLSTSLDIPTGSVINGNGDPLITSTSSNAAILIDANNITITGLRINATTVGIGSLNASPVTATGILIEDCTFTPGDADCTPIAWSRFYNGGAVENTIGVTINGGSFVGGNADGFGIHVNISSTSTLRVNGATVYGYADAIQALGNAAAIVDLNGVTGTSTTDAIATGGPRMNVTGGRYRGDQADVNGDGGAIYLSGVDHRISTKIGSSVYEVINGTPILTANGQQEPAVLTVLMGGTGGKTASAARDSLTGGSSGIIPGTVLAAATSSAQGASELATSAEVTTGSDTTRTITPDALRGSDAGKRIATYTLLADSANVAIVDGISGIYFRIPVEMNGWNLVDAGVRVMTPSSSGTPTFQIRRQRLSSPTTTAVADMLVTNLLKIDANEYDSKDAATARSIDTSNDDVQTGDAIYFDCDVAGTGTKGLTVSLVFQKP